MRIRRLSIVAAATVVAPVLIVLPQSGHRASAGQETVATSERSVELLAPSAPAVAHGTVASRRDLALATAQAVQAGVSARAATVASPRVLEVSPAQAVPSDVAVVGVSWSNDVGRSTVVQYRTYGADAWSDWQAIDADAATSSAEEGTRSGSDPIVVTGATQVQARVLGPAGGAPADARLTVIDPGQGEGDDGIGTAQPGAAEAGAARPRIHSRAEWGANESWRKDPPSYMTIKGVVVHHTAGTNNYSPSQVPAILRGIYAFHTKDRGWNDIAYNFLVDKWGRVWEGRYGGVSRAVQGAHATGYNTQTMGVSVLGDYNKVSVPSAAVTSVAKVIAWKGSLAGYNPDAMTTLYGRRERTVQGHRDVGQTTCPGTSLYAQLPTIRRTARSLMTGSYAAGGGSQSVGSGNTATAAPSTPAPSGADVLMRSSSGALFRSAPLGSTGLTYASKLSGSSWAGYDAVLSAGDLTRDGRADVLARVRATGRLVLFTGGAGNTLTGARAAGAGWGSRTHLVVPGDLTGDRVPDLLAVDRRTGDLFLYRSTGTGGFRAAVRVGRGFGVFTRLAGVGDWNGDGKADLIGVNASGTPTLFRGNGTGGFVTGSTRLAGSWGYRTLVGLPGARAVLAVDGAGAGYLIGAQGATGIRVTKVSPSFRGLTVFAG